MINANELRVGNWVRHYVENSKYYDYQDLDKYNFKVDNITICGINTTIIKDKSFFGFKIDSVQEFHTKFENTVGISLTPEILEKCVFEKRHSRFDKKPLSISLGSNENIVDYHDIWYIGAGRLKAKHIKYLHQLQNLYWCLTGEELTVNL